LDLLEFALAFAVVVRRRRRRNFRWRRERNG
jgi:hypothetical protein